MSLRSSGVAPSLEKIPTWKHLLNVARSTLVLATGFVAWMLMASWLRFWVLHRFRNDESGRIAAINRLIRLWGLTSFRLTQRVLGVKLVIEGQPPTSGRYVIVSNHQSWLDVPLFLTVFPALNMKFVATENIRHGKPAVSLGLRHGGFAFVTRRSLAKDFAELERFGRQLERFDGSPSIFPEGRRSDDGLIQPFHCAGIEVVRRSSGLPILPVTVEGLWRGRTFMQLHRLAGARVTVRIHDPIPFDEVDRSPRSVYERLEALIRRTLDEIRMESDRRTGRQQKRAHVSREDSFSRQSR